MGQKTSRIDDSNLEPFRNESNQIVTARDSLLYSLEPYDANKLRNNKINEQYLTKFNSQRISINNYGSKTESK